MDREIKETMHLIVGEWDDSLIENKKLPKTHLIATIKKGSTFAWHLAKNQSHITPSDWSEREGWIIWDISGCVFPETIEAMITSIKIRYSRFRYGPQSYKLDITFQIHDL